jgi:hypothetical protein
MNGTFTGQSWMLYVDGYPDGDFGPLLGVRQLPLSINTPRSTEDCIEKVTFYSQRGVLDNLFMMLWETKRDNMNRLRNQIEKEIERQTNENNTS